MAKPRIFVSSTCYDLKEIRSQIREFIQDYGYEPILSEFGDIFFDYGEHPQDSCFKEIEKCQMFVLIIGNSFGSTYYRYSNSSSPNSITMEEFEKSIRCDIPKHVFINRFVEYDYQNYVRAWEKHIRKLSSEGKLSDDNIENKKKLRQDFDNTYPFASDSYKNLFRFIERIYVENVGIQTFEYSSDIKDNLKLQWAGAMYTFLTKDKSIPKREIASLSEKIDGVSATLRSLLEVKDSSQGNELSFDLSSVRISQNLSSVEKIKSEVFGYIEDILTDNGSPVIELQHDETISKEEVERWLNTVVKNIDIFKWQPYISLPDLFSSFEDKIFIYLGRKSQISTTRTLDFCLTMQGVKEKLSTEDYQALLTAIYKRFKDIPVDVGPPF